MLELYDNRVRAGEADHRLWQVLHARLPLRGQLRRLGLAHHDRVHHGEHIRIILGQGGRAAPRSPPSSRKLLLSKGRPNLEATAFRLNGPPPLENFS